MFCRWKWESWVWAPRRVSPLYPPEDSYSGKCHSQEQHPPLNLKSVVSAGYYMSLTNHTFHATLVTLTRTLPTFWVRPPSNHTIVSVHMYACMYFYIVLQKDYVYLHCDLYTPPNSVCRFWVFVDKTVDFFSVERFQIKSQLSTSPLLVAAIHIMPPFQRLRANPSEAHNSVSKRCFCVAFLQPSAFLAKFNSFGVSAFLLEHSASSV